MATLFKNSNSPIWRARYFDANGKRVSKTTGTALKREAKGIAEEFEAAERRLKRKAGDLPRAMAAIIEAAGREAAAGDLTLARAEGLLMRLHRLANPDYRVVTLSDHLHSWIKQQDPHVRHATGEIYRDMHRRITAAVGKKISAAPVGNLTQDQVRAAILKIHSGGLRASTVNMDLLTLRRAMKAAVSDGLAKDNPAADVRPLPDTDSVPRAPFTAAEVRLLIDAAPTDEWRGLILIGAHTGLRCGDVARLDVSNIIGDRFVVATEKTGKTVAIPITPPVRGWLGERKGALFPTLGRKVPAARSKAFKVIMAAAGVAAMVDIPGGAKASRSFHSLRHSFASWLADADVHSDVRQKLTGHASSGIHSLYTHHDAALDRAVALLPSF